MSYQHVAGPSLKTNGVTSTPNIRQTSSASTPLPAALPAIIPGSSTDDAPYDQVFFNLYMANAVDEKGMTDLFVPAPNLDGEQIKKFLEQSVQYTLNFDLKTIDEAKKELLLKFGDSPLLRKFFATPLMIKTDLELQYPVKPKEFYQELYDLACDKYSKECYKDTSGHLAFFNPNYIKAEITGGHARQILHNANGAPLSWAETYLRDIAKKDINAILPQEIREKRRQSPPDSDGRITLPGASPKILNELSAHVIDLIVDKIQEMYQVYSDPQFKPYLRCLIELTGLKKYNQARPYFDNIYSIVSFGQKAQKNLELLFVDKMQRQCMFSLDAMKIAFTPLLRDASAPLPKPATQNGLYGDLQYVIDNFTYALHCPSPETADRFVWMRGLSHQIKGARYLEANIEKILLNHQITFCKQKNINLAEEIAHGVLKCHEDHGHGNPTSLMALTLRALCSLKKFEKELPSGTISAIWDQLRGHCSTAVPTTGQQQTAMFQLIATVLKERSIDFETLHHFLQVASLLRLSVLNEKSGRMRAFITRDGGDSAIQFDCGDHILLSPDINAALDELYKRIEKTPRVDISLQRLLDWIRPEIFTFSAPASLARNADKLKIEAAKLEKSAFAYLKSTKPILQQIGFQMLFACYSLNANPNLISIIMENLPGILLIEKDPQKRDGIFTSIENLLAHAKLIQKPLFVETRKKLVEKKTSFDIQLPSIIEDLLQSGVPKLIEEVPLIWRQYNQLMEKSARGQAGIALARKYPHHFSFSRHLLLQMHQEKALSTEDMLPIFDSLCAHSEFKHLTDCHQLALLIMNARVVTKGQKTAPPLSKVMPGLIHLLIQKNLYKESQQLLSLATEKSYVVATDPKVKSAWIVLCKHHLKASTSHVLLDCWNAARVSWESDKDDSEKNILLLDIVNRLLDSSERAILERAHALLGALSKSLSPTTKATLSKHVLERLQQHIENNAWDKLDQEIDKRYSSFLEDKELLALKVQVLQHKLKNSSVTECISLATQLLESKADPMGMPAFSAALTQLFTRLFAAEGLDEINKALVSAYALMKQRRVQHMLKGNLEQRRDLVMKYLTIVTETKSVHAANGCSLLEAILETPRQPFSATQIRIICSFLTSLLEGPVLNVQCMAPKLTAHIEELLENCCSLKLPLEAWKILQFVNRQKETLLPNETRGRLVCWAADQLLDDPQHLNAINQEMITLKWFKEPEEYLEKLLQPLHLKLANAFLKSKDYQKAYVWIKRLNLDQVADETKMEWARLFLANTKTYSNALELYLHINTQNIKPDTLLAFVTEVYSQNSSKGTDLLLNHQAALSKVTTIAEFHKFVSSVASSLVDQEAAKGLHKTLQLMEVFPFLNRDFWPQVLARAKECDRLQLASIRKKWMDNKHQVDDFKQCWKMLVDAQIYHGCSDIVESLIEIDGHKKLLNEIISDLIRHHKDPNHSFKMSTRLVCYISECSSSFNDSSLESSDLDILNILLHSETSIALLFVLRQYARRSWSLDSLYSIIPRLLDKILAVNPPRPIPDIILKQIGSFLTPEAFHEEKFMPLFQKILLSRFHMGLQIHGGFIWAIITKFFPKHLKEKKIATSNTLTLAFSNFISEGLTTEVRRFFDDGLIAQLLTERDSRKLKAFYTQHQLLQPIVHASGYTPQTIKQLENAVEFINEFEEDELLDALLLQGYAQTIIGFIEHFNHPLLFTKYMVHMQRKLLCQPSDPSLDKVLAEIDLKVMPKKSDSFSVANILLFDRCSSELIPMPTSEDTKLTQIRAESYFRLYNELFHSAFEIGEKTTDPTIRSAMYELIHMLFMQIRLFAFDEFNFTIKNREIILNYFISFIYWSSKDSEEDVQNGSFEKHKGSVNKMSERFLTAFNDSKLLTSHLALFLHDEALFKKGKGRVAIPYFKAMCMSPSPLIVAQSQQAFNMCIRHLIKLENPNDFLESLRWFIEATGKNPFGKTDIPALVKNENLVLFEALHVTFFDIYNVHYNTPSWRLIISKLLMHDWPAITLAVATLVKTTELPNIGIRMLFCMTGLLNILCEYPLNQKVYARHFLMEFKQPLLDVLDMIPPLSDKRAAILKNLKISQMADGPQCLIVDLQNMKALIDGINAYYINAKEKLKKMHKETQNDVSRALVITGFQSLEIEQADIMKTLCAELKRADPHDLLGKADANLGRGGNS